MQELTINEELQNLIPALSEDEFETLKASIKAEGCREPIVVWGSTIVDGHNRYKICQELELPFETQELAFESLDAAKVWMIDNQKGRRNLSDGWKFELALVKKEALKEKGREKQSHGQTAPGKTLLSESDNSEGKSEQSIEPPQAKPKVEKRAEKHNTQDEVAKELGWSKGKTARAEKVWKEADEKTKEQVKESEKSIQQAYDELLKEQKKAEREAEIEQQKQEIEEEAIQAPDGLFDVIVVDPPWEYSERGGFSSKTYDPESNRGSVDYPTMTVQELKDLELPAKDDCTLFLWTTHAFIYDAFNLLSEWGFSYKAIITWDKDSIGMGRTIRLQCEFCLLGVKGSPLLEGSSVRDIIREKRREHSRKPEQFYELVEKMTTGRRLDYFAREKRENWEVYGNQTDKF